MKGVVGVKRRDVVSVVGGVVAAISGGRKALEVLWMRMVLSMRAWMTTRTSATSMPEESWKSHFPGHSESR